MSKFENSEIWVEYANNTIIHQIKKEATSGRELVRGLGLDALFLGAGAYSGVQSGAGLVAGALGVAGVSSPIGWIILATISVGGLIATIYTLATKTEYLITDLIGRAEALDYEGTMAETVVTGWIKSLEEKNKLIQPKSLAGKSKEEQAVAASILKGNIEDTLKYLKDMQVEFEEIKQYLEDWQNFIFNDPKDFEESLKENIAHMENMLEQYKAKANDAAQKFLQSLGKDKTPQAVVTRINELDAEISKLWAKPKYDAKELRALEFAKQIANGEADLRGMEEYMRILVELKITLETKILPKAKKLNSKLASNETEYKKVAVTLPKEPNPDVGKTTQPSTKPIAKRRRIQKNDAVVAMQSQINDLSTALDIPITRLKEDGVYGPLTARAAADLIGKLVMMDPQKYPEYADTYQVLKKWGITGDIILDYRMMNKTPRLLNRLINQINDIYQLHVGNKKSVVQHTTQQKQPMSQRDILDAGWKCNPDQQNPSRQNMLNCFKRLETENINLYDYATKNLKMSDQDIIGLIYDKYPGWAPRAWSASSLLQELTKRKSLEPSEKLNEEQKILSNFKNLRYNIGGSNTNLYNYAIQSLGMSDRDIVSLIKNKYPNTYLNPRKWSTSSIVESLGNRHSIL